MAADIMIDRQMLEMFQRVFEIQVKEIIAKHPNNTSDIDPLTFLLSPNVLKRKQHIILNIS